jgi:uncharacterized protein (TIGR02757 family)
MLSRERARRLKPLLDRLLDPRAIRARIEHDPVRFPRRFQGKVDAEVAGLLAASLAYGKAEVFLARLDSLFDYMGESPSRFALEFDPRLHRGFFGSFSYRFNTGADIGALISAIGALLRRHGSLEAAFLDAIEREGPGLQNALAGFIGSLRSSVDSRAAEALGEPRALGYLLPDPLLGSASKRHLMFLRWMVRRDGADLGIWKTPGPAALLVPLDTHLARISRKLGLTSRKEASWRTAEEVTASLRLLDSADPVRYDFALCHLGMSGRCPARQNPEKCAACALRAACR